MNKAELIEKLLSERAAWDSLIADIGEARGAQPGAAGRGRSNPGGPQCEVILKPPDRFRGI